MEFTRVIDICQSSYDHAPMERFNSKKFLKKHGTADIICSDCLNQWILDTSRVLAYELLLRITPVYEWWESLFVNNGFDPPSAPLWEGSDKMNHMHGHKHPCHDLFKDEDDEDPPVEEIPEENDSSSIENRCPCVHIVPDPSEVEDTEDEDDGYGEPVETGDLTPSYSEVHGHREGNSKPFYKDSHCGCVEDDDNVPHPDHIVYHPKYYPFNSFATAFEVNLPSYMKHILCSKAEVDVKCGCNSRMIGIAKITFNGPCSRPTPDNCDCNTLKEAQWTPVAELISPKPYLHEFTLELYIEDFLVEDRLMRRIYQYIAMCTKVSFGVLHDYVVEALMDDAWSKKYHSTATTDKIHGIRPGTCTKCGITSSDDVIYMYQNNYICIDDLYKIVVKLAVEANLAEEVGLALSDERFSEQQIIRTTRMWKRTVIDRYMNAMEAHGANPEIRHVNYGFGPVVSQNRPHIPGCNC